MKVKLTDSQKKIVEALGDKLFTVDFIEEYYGRNDNVMINAPAALQECEVEGFMRAVKIIEAKGFEKPAEAQWLPVDEKNDAFDCSNCIAMVQRPTDRCPKCGAVMTNAEELRETAQPLPLFEKFMTVSTSHLTPKTRDCLMNEEEYLDEAGLCVYQKEGYGWFVYTCTIDAASAGAKTYLPDLFEVLTYARERGFELVIFDCDADRVSDLPVYEEADFDD